MKNEMSDREVRMENVSILCLKQNRFGNRYFLHLFFKSGKEQEVSCQICICKPSISKSLLGSGCKYMKYMLHSALGCSGSIKKLGWEHHCQEDRASGWNSATALNDIFRQCTFGSFLIF